MSVTVERRIVDFAESAVECAKAEEGALARGMHEAILRLHEEGLLHELLAHSWVKAPSWLRPADLDRGSSPVPKRGCAFAIPAAVARVLGFWLNPKQVVNEPREVRS